MYKLNLSEVHLLLGKAGNCHASIAQQFKLSLAYARNTDDYIVGCCVGI